ncbi:LacI family transcriptional regulator [Clavibacter michiganensis]|uniref:LacI family transcriptional regulator n=1 Tax=Clavibacter michiganensis TaxID=28447 RepID=A0A2S5VXQ4_9MICO|nr:LacI family DNA-binding transcriptional regulator [Clavibacter michiganensis]PPF71054.1 LacI family transcriptional regulator [Clavibacter michiganensis]
MPRATIRDVAARAQVSISTVSKALSGNQEISEDTRIRVRRTAAELSYQPRGSGRPTRSGSTRAVGLLTQDGVGRLSLPVLLGAENAVGTERMSVLLCDSRGDDVRGAYQLNTLLEHGIDGLIVLADDTNDQPSLGPLGVPVVYAYGASTSPADFSVVPDEEGGARDAVRHLVSHGRTRIAHVTGPDWYAATGRRAQAWRAALQEAGLRPPAEPIQGAWAESTGHDAVDALLDRGTDFDAIFCGSDMLARGVVDQLRDRGRRVPTDVAVVGFDNWELMSTGSRPPLTTIDMRLEAVGRAAVSALFAAIGGQARTGIERVPTELVVRAST